VVIAKENSFSCSANLYSFMSSNRCTVTIIECFQPSFADRLICRLFPEKQMIDIISRYILDNVFIDANLIKKN